MQYVAMTAAGQRNFKNVTSICKRLKNLPQQCTYTQSPSHIYRLSAKPLEIAVLFNAHWYLRVRMAFLKLHQRVLGLCCHEPQQTQQSSSCCLLWL